MAGFKLELSDKEAQAIAAKLEPPMALAEYGKMLGGHSGSIYYLKDASDQRVIINLGFPEERQDFERLHNVMGQLADKGVNLAKPLGQVGSIGEGDEQKIYRASAFVPGTQINRFSVEQVRELGRQLGKVHATTPDVVAQHGWLNPKLPMLGQTTPSTINHKYQKVRKTVADDPVLLEVVDKAAGELFDDAKLHRNGLPRGLRHGDFKGKNLIYTPEGAPVLIDWEHMDCGILLSEVAFVMQEVAYSGNVFDRKKAQAFLQAYNKERPLQQNELDALPEWLMSCSKLHNLLRGIGIGIKYKDDALLPPPGPQDRLVMHKSLCEFAQRKDWGLPDNDEGIPREKAKPFKRKPRVLVWVESRSGSGHINLVASSARELKENGYDVYVVTASQQYVKQSGLDKYATIVPLPGFLTDQPEYQGTRAEHGRDEELTIYHKLPMEDERWNKERTDKLLKTLNDVQPDIFITEEYPMTRHPAYGQELETALAYIHSRESQLETRPLVFSMIKDIALATNAMIREPAGGSPEAASAIVRKYYDHIFVKGDETVVPIWETAPFLERHKDQITHLGYMVHAGKHRRDTDMPDSHRPVLVATGGSFDENALALVTKTIEARALSAHLSQHEWQIFVANDCPRDEFVKIQQMAEQAGGLGQGGVPNIAIMRNGPEYKETYPDAAASVIRCGYNTVNEAICHDVPSVVIPRPTSPEQNLRAKIFCELSNGKMQQMHNNDDARTLADKLDAAYARRKHASRIPEYGSEGYEKAISNAMRLREIGYFEAERNLLKTMDMKITNENGIRHYKATFVFNNFTHMHTAVMDLQRDLDHVRDYFDEQTNGWAAEGKYKGPKRYGRHMPPQEEDASYVRLRYHNHAWPGQEPSGGGTLVVESDNLAYMQAVGRQAGMHHYSSYTQSHAARPTVHFSGRD